MVKPVSHVPTFVICTAKNKGSTKMYYYIETYNLLSALFLSMSLNDMLYDMALIDFIYFISLYMFMIVTFINTITRICFRYLPPKFTTYFFRATILISPLIWNLVFSWSLQVSLTIPCRYTWWINYKIVKFHLL